MGFRLNKRTRKRVADVARGSISVLLVIVLVPVISVAGLFVDASRYQLARSEVAAAGDLTLNSALANYDSVLKDVYGLFAVSQNDPDTLKANLRSYFSEMLVEAGVAESVTAAGTNPLLQNVLDASTGDTSNLLSLSIDGEPTIEGVANSTLAQADVLKNQIVEFEKYRAPMNAAFSVLDGIACLSKMSKQTKVTQESSEVDEKIKNLNEACKELYDKAKEYEQHEKSGFYDLGSFEGKTYKEHYEKTIIPAAVESYLIGTVGEAYVKHDLTGHCGYSGLYNVPDDDGPRSHDPDYDKTVLISKANVANTSLFDLAKLASECVQFASDINMGQTANYAIVKNSANFANGSPKDKVKYLEAYNQLMSPAYGLQVCYEQYLTRIASLTKNNALNDEQVSRIEAALKVADNSFRAKELAVQGAKDREQAANQLARNIANDWDARLASLNALAELLHTCVDKASSIEDKVKEATNKNEEFHAAIGNYGSGDAFASQMEGNYEANKQTIDLEQFRKFKQHLAALESHANSCRAYLNSIRLMDRDPVQLSSIQQIKDRFGYVSVPGNGKSVATWMSENPNGDAVGVVMATYSSGQKPDPKDAKPFELKDDGFYRYLDQTFGGEKQDDSEAKSQRDGLNDAAKENAGKLNDAPQGLRSGSISEAVGGGTSDDGDDTSVNTDGMKSDGYTSMLSNMTDLLSSVSDIGGILTATRDNLYVMDYVFGMFSWYTQEKEAEKAAKDGEEVSLETATGIPINADNNYLYRSEVEYVLYGKDTAQDNVNAAKTFIFAVRFACNSIYALTDSELNAETLPPALAIQGASLGVIPYKIPQVVMKLALALAESCVDMHEMMEGNAVPFFKDASTWTMSVRGGINKAKELAVSAGTAAIDAVGKNIKGSVNALVDAGTDTLSEGIDDLGTKLQNAAQGQVNQAVDGAFNTFSESVILSVNRLSTRIGDDANAVAQEIIDSADRSAQTYIAQQSGEVHDLLKSAYDGFISDHKENLRGKISETLNKLKNDANAKASELITSLQTTIKNTVNEKIGKVRESIGSKLKDGVASLSDEVKSTVGNEVDKVTEQAKAAAADKVNTWFDDRFGDYTGTSSASGATGEVSSGFASCIKFKYSDYLRMIFFVKMALHGDDQIGRVGNLIAVNIKKADEGSRLHHAVGDAFSLGKAYTYYRVKADIKLDTMFLALPVITERTGKEGVSAFGLTYTGALGY